MVHTESFYPKGIEADRYIGRYLGHPPLATSHLTDYDGKTVTFWYKDTQTSEKIVVRCPALDFISYLTSCRISLQRDCKWCTTPVYTPVALNAAV
jgi:hypothetical protein